jgi:DNA-binding MarR family transcriptional regulator
MKPRWGLVSNHGHVLAFLAGDQDARLRDIAGGVGITERTAAHIVNDLEHAGYVTRTRVGRRNRYDINAKQKIRTPRFAMVTTGQLLALLLQALEQPLL